MSEENRHRAQKQLRRLQTLVASLLKMKLDAEGLWSLQLKLLRLQQDVQELISSEKSSSTPDEECLQILRWTRHNARRFGDAFAWLVMGADRQRIFPLADGSSVPIPSRDASTEGVVHLGREMWRQGWGFPLLHDVTNILRLGDITFVNVAFDTTNTVEVKSRKMGEPVEGTAEYAATAHFAGRPTLDSEKLESSRRLGYRTPSRLNKQLLRLSDAQVHQRALGGMSADSQGKFVTIDLQHYAGDYFEQLGRICRSARRRGYADVAIDGYVCYVAVYNPNGITEEDLIRSPMVETIAEGLAVGSGAEADGSEGLILRSVPGPTSRIEAERSLPYFLYPLPMSSILDIIAGRMSIAIVVNLGKILRELKSQGIDSEVSPRSQSVIPEVVLRKSFSDATGGYTLEYHLVEQMLIEFIMDFRSLDYVVAALKHVFEQIQDSAANIMRGSFNPEHER